MMFWEQYRLNCFELYSFRSECYSISVVFAIRHSLFSHHILCVNVSGEGDMSCCHVIPQVGTPSLCQVKGHATVTLTITKFSKDILNYFLNMNNVEITI